MQLRRILTIGLALITFASLASAQITTPLGNTSNSGREYFVGTSLGQPLFTVNLVNGVNSPGVCHVPASTNMAELFSYAGGLTPDSDLDNIVVRSVNRHGQCSVVTYDFESDFNNKKNEIPRLNDRDTIYIEQKTMLNETVKWMSIAAMAASIATALIYIEDRR